MKQKPGTFDAFRLAREGGVLEGTLDAMASDRLADRVADVDDMPGEVTWRIEGTKNALGRPALAIGIRGQVPVECQRCLEPFSFAVDQRTVTVLAKSEAEADALDADSEEEVLVADHPLIAADLVEDELLLTLPFAPMHDPGACNPALAGDE
ncbi:MAG: YceD family protein [Burkholderiales bacterium]